MNLLHKFFLIVALTSTTSLGMLIAQQDRVEARPCGRDVFSRIGCTLDPTNPRSNGSLTETKFTVYVKNNTAKPIVVTAKYVNYFQSRRGQSCSTVDGGGANCDDIVRWEKSNWVIQPGQNAFIIDDAVGRNIYFSARYTDNQGGYWPEQQVDMGSQYRRFYYTFNP